jgi:hypothetical protein
MNQNGYLERNQKNRDAQIAKTDMDSNNLYDTSLARFFLVRVQTNTVLREKS